MVSFASDKVIHVHSALRASRHVIIQANLKRCNIAYINHSFIDVPHNY